MLTRISLATALALGLMAAPGMANEMNKDKQAMQSGQEGMKFADLQNRFSEFDTDGDGAISRAEWMAREKQLDNPPNFFVLNSDSGAKDDRITRQEWDNYFDQKGSRTTGAGQQ